MMYKSLLIGVMFLSAGVANAASPGSAIDEVLAGYKAEGVESFSAERGQALWESKHSGPLGENGQPTGEKFEIKHEGEPAERTCQTCHGVDLKQAGKHWRTGKLINPMSLTVPPVEVDEDDEARFSDGDKIEKWFRRNCKWTIGRECSAQEKGDILSYLRNQ